MDRRIIQYFAGQLSNEEQKSLLNEILENKELKAEMMQYRHLHTLINLQPGQADAQAGEESYHRFIARRQWQQKRHVLLVAMRYAAVLVIGVALTLWFNHALQHSASVEPQAEPMAQTLTVPAGQRAHITLPDGTRVWVNAGSKLTYASTFGAQRVVNIEGEAFFDVAKDPTKPFVVRAGKVNVRALGTQFSVFNYVGEPLVVSLIEGSVKVYHQSEPKSGVVLTSGERAVEQDGVLLKSMMGDDVLTWCDGVYTFKHQPLHRILRKLELYYDVKIIVNDPALLNLYFTGKFRQDDGVMEVLRIIQKIHPFSISRVDGSREIVINGN